LIAVAPDAELVAVARYVRLPEPETAAEVAVTVADAWQGRGAGTALLQRLARRARRAGIESFVGLCLVTIRDMQQLLRELSPHAQTHALPDGLVRIEAELPTVEESRSLAPVLRAAARGWASLRPR
jgi:GNAT superfamily N-acetyltransferase